MRRTIQTAFGCLDWLIEKGIKIEADADWQGKDFILFLQRADSYDPKIDTSILENTNNPCDIGTPAAKLAAEFPTVDFTALDPVYPDKLSPAGARYRYTRDAVLRRAHMALARLYARPEKVIIVVSHSGFLRAGVSGYWYENADYRIFDLVRTPDPALDGSNESNGANGANGANRAPGAVDGEVRYSVVQHDSTREKGGGLGRSWPQPIPLGTGLPESQVAAVDDNVP